MCTTSSAAFAWIGAILVNLGFITLVGWGASAAWPLGFALCDIYTMFLYGLAHWMMAMYHNNNSDENSTGREYQSVPKSGANENEQREAAAPDQEQEPHAEQGHANCKVSASVNLLFGLAVVSLGVTGLFLPINLFHQCQHSSGTTQPQYIWTTNISALPEGVRTWASSTSQPDATNPYMSSFGRASDVLLFSGSAYDRSRKTTVERLWTLSPGSSRSAPKAQPFYSPRTVVTVSDQEACFVACPYGLSYCPLTLYCFNGTTFRPLIDSTGINRNHGLAARAFFPYNETLWFQERADYQYSGKEQGTLIYSLNPKTMNLTLYSQRVRAKPIPPPTCHPTTVQRQQSVLFFVTTALPVTVASIEIWRQHHIPSMAITMYLGLSGMFLSFCSTIQPHTMNEPYLTEWWGCLSGLTYLLVMSCLNLLPAASPSHHHYKKAPFQWGLVMGSIAFALGTGFLLMGDEDRDKFVYWLLLNMLVFVPLLVLGAANTSIFVLFLGGCGFIVDAARFAGYVGYHTAGAGAVPVEFLVFAVTGLLVGALGFFQVNQYQHLVREAAEDLVQKTHQLVIPLVQFWRTDPNGVQEAAAAEEEPSTEAFLPPPGSDDVA